MGLIRPELREWLRPRQEMLVAALCVIVSGWIASWGGWFFAGLGFLGFAISAGWLLGSWRRLAFHRDIAAPGLVEIVEGEIRYFGARAIGGTLALRDLNEIRLLRLNGQDYWRLKTQGGEALLIPVEAKGADRLADAFSALPGLDLGRVSAALAQKGGPSLRIVWTAPKPATKSG